MRLREIINLINGELCTKEETVSIEKEYHKAFACDLMSDCLAYVNENCLLITGLINFQSLRTAEMLDIDCIIFVRGKKPSDKMITLAYENKLTLITTNLTMYEASGVLYHAGLKALKI